MKIVKIQRTNRPAIREQVRGKNFVQMVNPDSNQPLHDNDMIRLCDIEEIGEMLIVETKPHANYSQKKKDMFRTQRFYYRRL